LLSAGGLEAVRYSPVDDAIDEDRQEYYLDDSRRTVIRRLQELIELRSLEKTGAGRGSKHVVKSLHAVQTA
jgi:hypothetical protein